jgi:hypothetical protein
MYLYIHRLANNDGAGRVLGSYMTGMTTKVSSKTLGFSGRL